MMKIEMESPMSKLENEIVVSRHERLSNFRNYVERTSDDPDAQRTLTLISEFEKEVEENKRKLGEHQVGRSGPDDIAAARQRRFIAWFGRLRQFQEWLRSKGDDNAVPVLRWIAEFEHKQIEEWLKESVQGFLGDPPDNDFLCGFLSALLLVEEEAIGLPLGSPPFAEARELPERYIRDKRRKRDAA
jgi:hypothetical protein